MIDREHDLPITKQVNVLRISRGSVYYLPRSVLATDLEVMRRQESHPVGSFWSCPVFVAHQLSASVVCVVGLVGLVGNALALSTNPRGLKVAASKRITRRPSSRR